MKKDISNELIKKYLAGNCTQTEKELVDEWFASFEQAADLISDLPEQKQEQLKSNLLSQIKSNIQEAENKAMPAAGTKSLQFSAIERSGSFTFYAARIAAVLVLACGLGLIGYKYWTQPRYNKDLNATVVFSNPDKLVKKILLPDGSKVWLQENSSLALANSFGATRRMVTLTGEAFFDVAKDKTRPFEIKTSGVTTRVLGTSFNIKAYENGKTVEIAVVTGKVSVLRTESGKTESALSGRAANEKAAVVLMPNQKVTFIKTTQHLVKKEIPASGRKTIFSQASLVFENTPIQQAIQMLNTKFNTDIKLANDDINNCTIYGVFTDQNLPEILEVICKSIEAEYQLYKEEIIITGAGCPLNQPLP
ncbi:MAG: anti-FecI sigma factor, FecR [Adhaeribacter sp.]|nr:anti-FecI sigma factor, FecR [Adhaeribacter sp.]